MDNAGIVMRLLIGLGLSFRSIEHVMAKEEKEMSPYDDKEFTDKLSKIRADIAELGEKFFELDTYNTLEVAIAERDAKELFLPFSQRAKEHFGTLSVHGCETLDKNTISKVVNCIAKLLHESRRENLINYEISRELGWDIFDLAIGKEVDISKRDYKLSGPSFVDFPRMVFLHCGGRFNGFLPSPTPYYYMFGVDDIEWVKGVDHEGNEAHSGDDKKYRIIKVKSKYLTRSAFYKDDGREETFSSLAKAKEKCAWWKALDDMGVTE